MNTTATHPLALRRRKGFSRPSLLEGENRIVLAGAAFFAAHVAIGLLSISSSLVATAHTAATIVAGLALALFGKRLEHAVCACAYIMGAEVLWRMSEANIFWESGKYATALILLVAMIRRRSFGGAALPLVYFLLLVPSSLMLLTELEPEVLRRRVSFNLSGPLALMVCARFFSQTTLTTVNLQRIYIALIGPVVGVAAITLFTTWTATDLTFTRASNEVTSGGFGANQVSSALGLGALAALMSLLVVKSGWKYKALMFGVLVALSVQSVMTFSRGGMYNMAVGAVLAILCLSRDSQARVKVAAVSLILIGVAYFVVLPRLDAFTGGAFSERFSSADTTGRGDLALADIKIWLENPVLGVGPGQSTELHEQYDARAQIAHTEMTRLLSEHGLFGLVALLLLMIMSAQRFLGAPTVEGKAVVAASIGWSIIYMLNAAMRLGAPAFMIGLAFATVVPEAEARYRSARRAPTGANGWRGAQHGNGRIGKMTGKTE